MKSYEILPADMMGSGFSGGAKAPKAYEIMPRAGTAEQGLGGKRSCAGGCSHPRDSLTSVGLDSWQPMVLPSGTWKQNDGTQKPVYGRGRKSPFFGPDPADAFVDRTTIPRLLERCAAVGQLIDSMQNRIGILQGLRGSLDSMRTELRQRKYNPNPEEDPCATFRETFRALVDGEGRAAAAGDIATSMDLGRQAIRFHDEVWLHCDASRGATNRTLREQAAAFIDGVIGSLDGQIFEHQSELEALRTRYRSMCP